MKHVKLDGILRFTPSISPLYIDCVFSQITKKYNLIFDTKVNCQSREITHPLHNI